MAEPLFDWLKQRQSGVLAHVTSLPGPQGIGTIGPEAESFLDFLSSIGATVWQMCPLGPTGFGDSPYQCFSAFAGNPYLIDLRELVEAGLLDSAELEPLGNLPVERVDYGGLYEAFWPIFELACNRFVEAPRDLPGLGSFTAFCADQGHWLDGYASFTAAKRHFGGRCWLEWPKEASTFDSFAKSDLSEQLSDAILGVKFGQYVFAGQWKRLRAKATAMGIQLVGDAPIYVSLDSADMWANPGLFLLKKGTVNPAVVAGVPPDYFSATGQLWGNPLYDWKSHKADGYDWWIKRLRSNFELFDAIRLDHFIGFSRYYAIPAGSKDATTGTYQPGPGIELFEAVKKAIPEARIIAEDLGVITDEVRELLAATGFPGMTVLHFAFGDNQNPYLPHNHIPNQVCYPGTHDNDTTVSWYQTEAPNITDHFRRYFETDGSAPNWTLMRAALRSVARLSVVTLQDLLGLGNEARLNQPGTQLGNWQWRFSSDQTQRFANESGDYFKSLAALYGRL